jgi:DNA-binding PadR family transcriptional regulator
VLLHLLADRPRHGYDLIRAIENLTGGAYAPSPGVVYPTLTLLEELDLAQATDDSATGRRLYALTSKGENTRQAHANDIQLMLGRLAQLGRTSALVSDPEVQRAAQHVSRALVPRSDGAGWTPAQSRRVVEILDRAAAEIEQI